MSRIDITHTHQLSDSAAREAIDAMAAKLTEKLSLSTQWAGDVLTFKGSGVDGSIKLLAGAVNVAADLSFPASLMQGMVEDKIKQTLKEKLG